MIAICNFEVLAGKLKVRKNISLVPERPEQSLKTRSNCPKIKIHNFAWIWKIEFWKLSIPKKMKMQESCTSWWKFTVMIASESKPKSRRFPPAEFAAAESVKNLAILSFTFRGKRPPCKSNSFSVFNACFNSSFVRRGCDFVPLENSRKRRGRTHWGNFFIFWILPSRRSNENWRGFLTMEA